MAASMRYTIDEDTDAWLTQRGELTAATADGYRSISISVYSSTASPDDDSKTTIPVYINSTQTLEMSGFSKQAADEVLNLYREQLLVDENLELANFAKAYIDEKAIICHASLPGDDYRRAWENMGMEHSRIEALMAPQWEDMRFTMSAREQFKESVDATAEYLVTVSTRATRKRLQAEARGELQWQGNSHRTTTRHPRIRRKFQPTSLWTALFPRKPSRDVGLDDQSRAFWIWLCSF